jgi:hypothetical protein
MQLRAEDLRTTEEHTCLSRGVDLSDTLEYCVPVRTTKIRWGAKAGDCITVGIGIVDHDICCVVYLDLRCQVLEKLLAYKIMAVIGCLGLTV